ncbi:MAG: ferrichrome ABC transporter substrate-binding protein [Erysipelotrichaceae bacterium]
MKQNLKAITICACAVLLLVAGCGKKEEPKKETIKIVSNDLYETPKKATLEATKAYNKLSKALEGNNQQKIAELVAVNFAYDFFTLANKKDENQVGGLTFIPEISREEFTNYALSYYYGNYMNIVNKYGKEALPYMNGCSVKKSEEAKIIYQDLTYDGYIVNLDCKYKESDLAQSKLKTKMEVQVIYDNQDAIFKVVAVQ